MKKIYIIVLCDFKRRKTQMRKSIAKLIIALLVIITCRLSYRRRAHVEAIFRHF